MVKIADLFCGAGGAAKGLHDAGFEVVGFDIKPQKNYPYEFHQADAMEVDLSGFDAVWASPPCQGYSSCVNPELGVDGKSKHLSLVAPVRDMLTMCGLPFIIENVPGAPLRDYIKLNGTMFGLKTIKERWFECHRFTIPLMSIPMGWDARGLVKSGEFAGIMRHGKGSIEKTRREDLAEAYKIDWPMTRGELRLSIPPAYSEFLGRQLMVYLGGNTDG